MREVHTTCKRPPRDQPHTCEVTVFVHFAPFFVVYQAVMILHANELGPAMLLGAGLQHDKLKGPQWRRADVPDFPALDQIEQRFHCFFNSFSRIRTVDLE